MRAPSALIRSVLAAERVARRRVRALFERSRVARALATGVAVIAAALVLPGSREAPFVLPAAAGYAVIAAVIEWRREPSDAER